MEVERNWTRTRYTFICEDEKDKEFLDKMNKYIDKLEEENKKLKELLDITVQTKNEKIRNLLEEIEYYKKQCGED